MTVTLHRKSLAQIFLLPTIIALVVTAGLISALLGDGIWDMVSWLALVVPLAVIGFFLFRRTT